MKIYISADMEGIGCIVKREQLSGDRREPDYEEARHLLVKEVNAAVEGALKGGADEVVVLDAHYMDFNFPLEELHKEAKFVIGLVPPTIRFPFLDSSFDMMLLLGYHAMAGTSEAIRDHTFSSANFQKITVNGIEMGEVGMDALVCGHFNVPVAMVSGDDKVCAEARKMLGEIETATVKYGIGRHCALAFPPARSREIICEAACSAVKNKARLKPFRMDAPYEVEITYNGTDLVDRIPVNGIDIIRTGSRKVMYRLDSALDIATKPLIY